jgi:hypothetical protein
MFCFILVFGKPAAGRGKRMDENIKNGWAVWGRLANQFIE